MKDNKFKKEKVKIIDILLFIIYCLFLIYILFLRRSKNISVKYNIVPFKTYIEYFTKIINSSIDIKTAILNFIANIFLFVPMGYFLPKIFKKVNSFNKTTIISMLIIILIEVMQYITKLGIADIDDVILNTIGAMIGYKIQVELKSNFTT